MSEEEIEALLQEVEAAEGAAHLEGEVAIDVLADRKLDHDRIDWNK